jgi:folate-dependent phosphoribosylglycinamide formyltransferase PurN
MRTWVAFFSQTGSEIYNVSQKAKRFPDLIITNKNSLDDVSPLLIEAAGDRILQISDRPSAEEYMHHIPKDAFVTLHGWLRIVPAKVCEAYEIYNLHPANLLLHPHLKGKDPQKRAAAELLKWSGNTIHRCTPELDAGEALQYSTILIEGLLEFEVIDKLHKDATKLWYNFLHKRLLFT